MFVYFSNARVIKGVVDDCGETEGVLVGICCASEAVVSFCVVEGICEVFLEEYDRGECYEE